MVRSLVFVSTGELVSEPELDERYNFFLWRPGMLRVIPPGMSRKHGVMWLKHYLRFFRNRGYSVLYIMHQKVIVHRCCLIPGYFRTPYMEREDLQITMTHTYDRYKNQGFAKVGLRKALTLMRKPGRRFWYLVRENNLASITVCTGVGFECIGYRKNVGSCFEKHIIERQA